MGEPTRGSFTASQVSAGRKNRLYLEIHGIRASAAWSQERPDELWIGKRDMPNGVMVKDPALMEPGARAYADLPGGHSEGYGSTFKQLFRRFYASIVNEKADERAAGEAAMEYPSFDDGLRQLAILEAELKSHAQRGWVGVPAV
jgi:predicted dehydrogenase